eukprot:TRINITY_DN7972_c0_g1_i1.p1 TRINITY_DN7972_c0_g1~~TRINITY_DN7972_c0_g1_i1.p1  ORF type:complete len:366 (-),score=63.80 TRINITY_DN7972_c0_g1_i1:11-1108(-)
MSETQQHTPTPRYELKIIFHSAKDLPSGDINGLSDPFIKATLDNVSYKTRSKEKTLNPKWEETWAIHNVDVSDDLKLEIWDKDLVSKNDFLGLARLKLDPEALLGKTVPTAYVLDVYTPKHKKAGTVLISVTMKNSADSSSTNLSNLHAYKISNSKVAGLVAGSTTSKSQTGYLTYTITMSHIPSVFKDKTQPWNKDYAKAQQIFGPGAKTTIVRGVLRAQHSTLYSRHAIDGTSGMISTFDQFLKLFNYGMRDGKFKMYTYVLTNSSLRFSETGAATFKDFMSKHAMHADGKREVRYAGEFHIKKLGDNKYKIVFDNNSGTYAPRKDDLPLLVEVFKLNFPQSDVEALDFKDPKLKEYTKDVER